MAVAFIFLDNARYDDPGDMVFRYRAAEPGTTTLELGYQRPFETGVAPAKKIRYDVTVLSPRHCWLPGTVVCGLE